MALDVATPATQNAARGFRPLRSLLRSKLVAALAYPHTVDHYLELVSPSLSVDRIRAEVVDVLRETSDVVTLVLKPNRNFAGHTAGQYAAITVEIDGVRHTRCFSLSSAPERGDGLLTMTIKARAQGGLVSPFLVKRAHKGMLITLTEPKGEFVLPARLPEQLLFISGGSGITPCMSMLRSALARGYRGRITFVHFARTPADVIFASELRSLAHVHPNLKLVIETESERGSLPDLTADSLAAIVPDFAAWDAWVCGPAPLMDAARRIYAAQGAADKLRTEQFVLATPNVLDNQAGQVAFARAKKSLTGDARTLLEQAEASGIDGRRGCGMGICMSCRCKKLSGVTRNLRTGQLSTDENEEIQLCISVPVGDVTIDL